MITDLYHPEEILQKVAEKDAQLILDIIEKEAKNEDSSAMRKMRRSLYRVKEQVEHEQFIKRIMES